MPERSASSITPQAAPVSPKDRLDAALSEYRRRVSELFGVDPLVRELDRAALGELAMVRPTDEVARLLGRFLEAPTLKRPRTLEAFAAEYLTLQIRDRELAMDPDTRARMLAEAGRRGGLKRAQNAREAAATSSAMAGEAGT